MLLGLVITFAVFAAARGCLLLSLSYYQNLMRVGRHNLAYQVSLKRYQRLLQLTQDFSFLLSLGYLIMYAFRYALETFL